MKRYNFYLHCFKLIFVLTANSIFLTCTNKPTLTAKLWEPIQFDISINQSPKNTYWDVPISALFFHEKDTIKINGFWFNKDTAKIRFTPTKTGSWQYRILKKSSVIKQGIIEVKPTNKNNHGFVRRDKRYPYHFVFDDGTRYFMFGTTYYNMVLNACAGDRWKTAIDSALVFGINKIRVFANSSKSLKTPYPDIQPFLKTSDSIDYNQLNPEYWKALDRIVEYSLRKGMVIDLIMLGYGAETYATEEQDKNYIRYLLARYAAYPNIIWCLTNEWNYIYRDYGRGKPFWNSIGEIVRTEDPYMKHNGQLRPLSIHQQTRVDFQFFNYDWPVHAIVQLGVRNGQGTVKDEWDDSDPEFKSATKFGDEWGNYSIIYNLGHNMPVVNDEFGYIGEPLDKSEATNNDRSTWPAFTREKHRNVMWGIVLGGGYGSTGDKNKYTDGHPYFSANWHSDPEEYKDIKVLVDFFTSGEIEYWKMFCANNIITQGNRVYALCEPGKQYLFYSALGNEFRAEIEPGNYKVKLINPVTGEQVQQKQFNGKEFELCFNNKLDWIVYLTK